ncbi:uncharacterized protein LOC132698157 [Cylas formicarius]|uniref:uncharacterized protein LOC132698157 n=1 Tax=Cylas formicarius TaxID=197179 RepID=UPI002958A68D|nr:uncharacterized protein LOC132698157 [Cylas formicarius]
MKEFCAIVVLAAVLTPLRGQIHYVPAQVLIPTINGTYVLANSSATGTGYRPPASYVDNQRYNNSLNTRNNTSGGVYNGTQDGHLFVGDVQLYDRLLFSQVFRKEGRWWGNREKTIEYPQASPAGYTRQERISSIRIYNQFLDGNSARASIIKGGVGFQYVKIRLESKWGKGFQYLVQIYGH